MKAVIYLLQVSACTGIFYLFYYLFLRRFTFFALNRWYLLTTLLLSFIIPAITIPISAAETSAIMRPVMYVQQVQAISVDVPIVLKNEETVSPHTDWMLVAWCMYLIMALISITHLLISLIVFFWRMKNEKLLQIGNVKVLKANRILGNSSFLNVIFINDEGLEPRELKQVIAHELLHVKLMHSADRLMARLIQVILWFNPFVYLYTHAIEENHEFEVDRIVANDDDKGVYAQLLFKLAASGRDYLFHGFSKVPIKKRIAMIFNQPTNNMKKIVYVLMLPLVVISCLAFANFKNKSDTATNAPKEKVHKVLWQADRMWKEFSISYTPARLAKMTKEDRAMIAYQYTEDARQKRELACAVMNKKTLTLTITGAYKDKKGKAIGFLGKYEGHEYLLYANYGQGKQLNYLLKTGDEITISPWDCSFLNVKDRPVSINPAYIEKNNKRVFELAEANIPNYAFLSEPNHVNYAEGQISNIVKYANGKWKTALFETVNGYSFNLSFKPNAPDLNKIEWDDHVRLRFVNEVKTGVKKYKVDDWVSIKTYEQEYKSPELFNKYYADINN